MLRFYGVSLDEMWDGRRTVWSVASCAGNMPRGGAVGEWYGGGLAVTAETEALWEITYVLAQVNSKKKVKPRPMPKGVREAEIRKKQRDEQHRRWRRKHG